MFRSSTWLFIATLTTTLLSFAGIGTVQGEDGDDALIAVCISSFEDPIHVEWLTEEQIAEIEALVEDPFEPPPPKIVGYPDPETGSCATENGELKDYDPDVYTPICVPSGPDRNGPLIVQLAINHYLPAYHNLVLADPVTGACPDANATLVESLVAELIDILRELLG